MTENQTEYRVDEEIDIADNLDTEIQLAADVATWGDASPRGGRAVMNRIMKDGAKVPMFFGQTLIRSLRDQGYSSTTSALCEAIDNSIQWGSKNVRVYFRQNGGRGNYQIDAAVLDDGKGMSPNVLKLAMSFGGSLNYDKRSGIGRYGMGMKTSALSMAQSFDVYTWQEPGAIYSLTLDVEEVGRSRLNMIEMADPQLLDDLPSEVASLLYKPMKWPNADEQRLVAHQEEDITEILGQSGTLVYLPDCDRMDAQKAKTLGERAIRELGRVYRRFIDNGLKIYVNNRLVESFDPAYWSQNSRHAGVEGLKETRSRLVTAKQIPIEKAPGGDKVMVSVRVYELPIEDWSKQPRAVRKNALRIYDDQVVTILRNDREMFVGIVPEIARRHSDLNWIRIQIDFTGELDEAFGISSNKQGVRPKPYVWEAISAAIGGDIKNLREKIHKFQATDAANGQRGGPSSAERQANEAESAQSLHMDAPNPTTPEEEQALEDHLKALAIVVKHEGEDEDAALERVRNSRYLTRFVHDPYWPFYHVESRAGRIILTLNAAHPFYDKVYRPLSEAALTGRSDDEQEDSGNPGAFLGAGDVLTGLQLMLFSLARTQSAMSSKDEERAHLFDGLRREWSNAFATQLTM
ncbi:hypothetical protein LCGC14_0801360 [marine sediment metagenome]|uniref:Histidine kinase/HSP90-like ATPase domain-containing protein n=1 Tax=marine sediment metagenome TaxID=412755 RepID=A0A0F9PPG0_9ZZZZ